MDVDIDIKPTDKPDHFFNIVKASKIDKSKNLLKKHNVGVYFQNIPVDGITGLSAIPFKEAESFGYMKIDFLSLNMLEHFKSSDQIKKLAHIEPDWTLLYIEDNVKKLFQISKHFKLIDRIKPNSIEILADCLALIRPGKWKLTDQYIQNKEEIRKVLYMKTDGFSFKRSHAIAYAINIVLQLHLLKAGII